MVKKEIYSFWIGCTKTLKNVTITTLAPAVAYTLLNAGDWMPKDYNAVVALVIAFGAYLTKNYVKNK